MKKKKKKKCKANKECTRTLSFCSEVCVACTSNGQSCENQDYQQTSLSSIFCLRPTDTYSSSPATRSTPCLFQDVDPPHSHFSSPPLFKIVEANKHVDSSISTAAAKLAVTNFKSSSGT